MHFTFRQYGDTTEITEIEKKPSQVRISSPRKKKVVYGPRRPDNLRRSARICVRLLSVGIREFGAPLFLTLTFRGDASDASFANDALRRFQVRLRGEFPETQSIFVPDLSPRGRIHFHGLVFNVPLHLGDTCHGKRVVAYGTERESRTLAKLWREGFVDAKQTDGSPGLANYLTKYITKGKGSGSIMFNAMRLLRTSNGFPKDTYVSGPIAELMARRYAERKPVIEWTRNNIFLGQITKKIYRKDV